MTADLTHIPVVVPEGRDIIDLSMGELDSASRHLGEDVLQAMNTEKRYAAFIELGVIWAKRTGDTSKAAVLIERFRGYSLDELFHALRMDEDDSLVGAVDPTSSTSEPSESS